MAAQPGFVTLVDGRFLVRGKFTPDENRLRLTELIVTVGTPEESVEITASTLRDLHLAQLISVAKGVVARDAHFFTPEGQEEAIAEIEAQGQDGELRPNPYTDEVVKRAKRRIKQASARPPKGAARGRGDAFYRRVALDLVELVESGRETPGGVLATLADIESNRLGVPVPVQTLRTWLSVARSKKFLAPGEQGRLVAIPGPLLYATDAKEQA